MSLLSNRSERPRPNERDRTSSNHSPSLVIRLDSDVVFVETFSLFSKIFPLLTTRQSTHCVSYCEYGPKYEYPFPLPLIYLGILISIASRISIVPHPRNRLTLFISLTLSPALTCERSCKMERREHCSPLPLRSEVSLTTGRLPNAR